MRLLYFLLSLYLISYSCADRIILDEPPSQGIFPAGTYMDIRYRVRFEGMAKLHSASVALLNAETNQVITYFPAADWSEANSSVTRHGHALWYIPQNMPNGTYSIRVSGPSSFPCSRNHDGKAPYDRCHSTISKNVSFHILNSGNSSWQYES